MKKNTILKQSEKSMRITYKDMKTDTEGTYKKLERNYVTRFLEEIEAKKNKGRNL